MKKVKKKTNFLIVKYNLYTETNSSNYPKPTYSNYNPSEFIEISRKYYKNLKSIYKNNEIISKNDFLVLKELVTEGIRFCMNLFEQGFFEECKELRGLIKEQNQIIIDLRVGLAY